MLLIIKSPEFRTSTRGLRRAIWGGVTAPNAVSRRRLGNRMMANDLREAAQPAPDAEQVRAHFILPVSGVRYQTWPGYGGWARWAGQHGMPARRRGHALVLVHASGGGLHRLTQLFGLVGVAPKRSFRPCQGDMV